MFWDSSKILENLVDLGVLGWGRGIERKDKLRAMAKTFKRLVLLGILACP